MNSKAITKSDKCLNYWHCPFCKTPEHPTSTLHEAREQLEAHEKEVHKGKLIGTFGIKKA